MQKHTAVASIIAVLVCSAMISATGKPLNPKRHKVQSRELIKDAHFRHGFAVMTPAYPTRSIVGYFDVTKGIKPA